jgi:F-type H+-transporting ATPase subunit a
VRILAEACDPGDPGFCPPGTSAFTPPPLFEFTVAGIHFQVTRIMLLCWVVTAVILAFMVAAVRRPQLVPGRLQWFGESAYSFVRDGVAREVIGPEGVRFAPYLTALFLFILGNNLLGIIPLVQIAPTAKIAIPMFLAIVSWVLFNYVGIKRHGFVKYFKGILFLPGVPKPMYILVTPIEVFSTLIVRPFTLAVRLFANMFAGHMLLLVFTLGTAYLLTVANFSVIFAPVSFGMAVLMTFFELLVEVLQAYVFVILTSTYVAGALEEEH